MDPAATLPGNWVPYREFVLIGPGNSLLPNLAAGQALLDRFPSAVAVSLTSRNHRLCHLARSDNFTLTFSQGLVSKSVSDFEHCDALSSSFLIRSSFLHLNPAHITAIRELKRSVYLYLSYHARGRILRLSATNRSVEDPLCHPLPVQFDTRFVLLPAFLGTRVFTHQTEQANHAHLPDVWRLVLESGTGRKESWLGCTWNGRAWKDNLPISCQVCH